MADRIQPIRKTPSEILADLFLERGIALAIDEGECEHALNLCDQAIALGLGKAYAAKRASIERMT